MNKTGYEAKIITDTLNPYNGLRLTTFQLRYPRYIHGELMTHRVFSRNASSSRAIPVAKVLAQVWNEPVIPARFGSNIPGMQAGDNLEGWRLKVAQKLWKYSGRVACVFAWGMMKVGFHKQWANRVLEPWQFISVVLTATEFDNWFQLRNHKDAQPEIKILAEMMEWQMKKSKPKTTDTHIPYITKEEWASHELGNITLVDLIKYSVARCARVSYLTHEGKAPNREKDVELYDRLVGSDPIHASPTEHQATALRTAGYNKNFRGWKQHRVDVEKNNRIRR